MAAVAEIRQYVRDLRDMADAAGKNRDIVLQTADAMDKLVGTGGRMKLGFSVADIENARTMLQLTHALGGEFENVAGIITNTGAKVGQLRAMMERWGTTLGFQVPAGGGAGGGGAGGWLVDMLAGGGEDAALTPSTFIGSAQQFNRITQDQTTLVKALDVGLESIKSKYTSATVSVDDLTTKIDAANQVLEVHAKVLEEVGGRLAVTGTEQARISLRQGEVGKILPETSLKGALTERLNPQKLAAFTQQLSKMGLATKDLVDVQIEGATQVGRFTFRARELNGAVRSATVHIDKWGRILQDTGTRFKGFNQMISRNILKVTQWAISVGLVYGAWRQAQQMISFMIESQVAMADLAIVTGDATDEMGMHFERLAGIARETGTDLAQIMKASADAMKATGGLGGTLAFDLMADSATFAKLANLDLAKSTDVLVSSLEQMDMGLDEGHKLLDSWVAVSRVAKVSVSDLGQGFATTAAAAIAAGTDIDHLNAMLATMATVTNLTQQQNANALRAMFAAIQTPSTQGALEKYGIAIKEIDKASGELTGNLRDMPDILEDIARMMQAGILDEKALGEIAGALGGQGARRQAQFVSFLKKYADNLNLITVSKNAAGEADAAMAKKTDTLHTAVTNLSNAFKELGESLGTEGGVLDTMTVLIQLITKAIDGIEKITTVSGTSTQMFIAMAVALAAYQKTSIGARLGGLMGPQQPTLPGMPQPWSMAQGAITRPGAGMAALGGAGMGAMMGIPSMISAMQGEMEVGDAAARIGGSIAGGIVGNMILPGAGGVIGAYIGDSIIAKLQEQNEMMTKAFEEPLKSMDLSELEGIQGFLTYEIEDFENSWGRLSGPIGEGFGIWDVQLGDAKAQLVEIEQLIASMEEAEGLTGMALPPMKMERRFKEYQDMFAAGLTGAMQQRRMELPIEFAAGDIQSARDYNAAVDRTYEITNKLNPVFYAMESAMKETGETMVDAEKEYLSMGTTMAEWSDESVNFVVDLANAFNLLLKQVEETGEGIEALPGKAQQFIEVFQGLSREEMLADIEIPGFKDFAELGQEEFQDLIARAKDLQAQFGAELGIPPEAFESIERWAALVGENFEWVEGVLEQFVQIAKQEFDEYKNAQEDAFNVRRLKDVDPSKMAEIAKANRYWIEYLSRLKGMSAQEYMQEEGEQFNLILGPSNQLQQLNSTSEAMMFVLQDILEVEEKQLEGMWNIPSGATFWVPITSLFYQKGTGGGFPELPELIAPTERTAENTTEISRLSNEQKIVLDGILAEMRAMGYSVAPAKEWSDDAVERLIDAQEVIDRGWGTEGIIGPDVIRGITEGITPMMLPTIEGDLPSIGGETGVERIVGALENIGTTLHLATPTAELPGAGGLGFMDILRDLSLAFGAGPQEQPIDITVDIPEIDADITVSNVVTLDGAPIARYVTKVVGIALTKAIKASGKSTMYPRR